MYTAAVPHTTLITPTVAVPHMTLITPTVAVPRMTRPLSTVRQMTTDTVLHTTQATAISIVDLMSMAAVT